MVRPEVTQRSRLSRIADSPTALLSLVVVGAALAIGGVHLSTQLVLAGVALVAFVMVTTRIASHRARLRVTLVGAGLALAFIWTFLQWVPLPAALVEVMAPQTFAANEASRAITGAAAPDFLALSRDPSRTALAAVTLLGLWLTFLVATNVGEHRQDRRVLGGIIEVTGLMVLVVGTIQKVVGADAIFGVYTGSVNLGSQSFLTSFVNPNHGAALMMLAACTAYGLWLSTDEKLKGTFHLVAAGLLAVGVIATGSRSGAILVIVGLALISFVAYIQQSDEVLRRRIVNATIGGVCLAVVGGFVIATGSPEHLPWSVDGNLFNPELMGRWEVGFDVARANMGIGVGHGAFGVASTELMTDWSGGHVTYAHNLVLQAVADWGLPATLLIGALMMWGSWGAFLTARARLENAAVFVGLVMLGIQNLVEFSMWIPGVAYAAVLGLGWLAGDALKTIDRDANRAHRWARPRFRVSHAATVVVLAGLVLTGLQAVNQDPSRWQRGIATAVKAGKPGQISVDQMLTNHPSDFYVHTLAAHLAFHSDRKALGRKIADRALALAPHSPLSLRFRAQMELSDGRHEAALPYLSRLASGGETARRMSVGMVLGARHLKGLAEAFFGASSDRVMTALSLLRARGDHAAVEQLLIWSQTRFPDVLVFKEELLDVWRFKPGKEQVLMRLATEMLVKSTEEKTPERIRDLRRMAYLAQGHLMKREKKYREAWHLFRAAAALDEARAVRPLLQAGHTLVLTGEMVRLRALLKEVDGLLDDDPVMRGQYHHLRSELFEAEGNLRKAVTEMQRAVLYLKGHPTFHRRLAGLYDKMGDRASAAAVRKRLVISEE